MFYVFKNMKINGIKFQVKKLEKKKLEQTERNKLETEISEIIKERTYQK